MLAFSAGLCRMRARAEIVDLYPALYRQILLQHRFRRSFLAQPDRIAIEDLEALAGRVSQFPPDRLLIASSYHGRPVAFVCICARRIPLALVYQSMSAASLDALAASGVAPIKLGSTATPFSLFASLDRIRREGRYVAILIDVPLETTRRHRLLGYDIAVSSLASAYAQRSASSILPLFTRLAASQRISYALGTLLETVRRDVTQHLLDDLQKTIERDCLQYLWTSACPIFSDPAAKANALSFVPDSLARRDALMRAEDDPSSLQLV